MKRRMMLAAAVVLAWSAAAAAQQTLTMPPDGGNQRAEAVQQIGLVRVSVEYSSPDVHGPTGEDRRGKIWGTLVPYGIHDLGFNNAQGSVARRRKREHGAHRVPSGQDSGAAASGRPLRAAHARRREGMDADTLEELDVVGQLQLRPGRRRAARDGDA